MSRTAEQAASGEVTRNSESGGAQGSARPDRPKPVMLGVVGDSATGKTTLTRGIADIFGRDRVTTVCTDDYHKYDRQERKTMDITPLNPECNYIEIMEQHLAGLARGEAILKPVYQHDHGILGRPVLVEPRDIVIVEGLLGYHTRAMRDCFDVKVYLDPPEDLRRKWKIQRDTSKRNYKPEEVVADLEKREPDSEKYIRPQREHADIVVRYHPPGASVDVDAAQLDVRLVLRPALPHPYLIEIADKTRLSHYRPLRLSLARDYGKPVDVLEVEGAIPTDVSAVVEKVIWEGMGLDGHDLARHATGIFQDGDETRRSESLAITQLLLVAQVVTARANV